MAETYEVNSGLLTTNLVPISMRDYYSAVLLNEIRTRAVYNQFSLVRADFGAVDAKQIIVSEMYDLAPAIGSLTEGQAFFKGAFLAGKSYTLSIAERGNVIKTNEFHDLTQYLNGGNFESLVRGKLSWNVVESIDIMARNAYLASGNSNIWYAGSETARGELDAADTFDPDYADQVVTNMEARGARGFDFMDNIIAIAHPRVLRDFRADTTTFQELTKYTSAITPMTGEVGMWGGARFLKSNYARLPNAGETVAQTQVATAVNQGEGGPDSDDISGYKKYIVVDSTSGFVVGQEVSIHAEALGTSVLETDPTLEHKVITQIDSGNGYLYFSTPCLIDHAVNAYVTEARDIYPTIFVGNPGSVVWGVGLYPEVRVAPPIDDFQRILRVGWYGVFTHQLLRDTFCEVVISSASTANHGNP